ncbi:MAG: hypothetical protein JWO59_1298 [Chloroflexi bacterium]|jgi:uncharacterized protein|nr:hypothetical protein [Chloroflexota bacterium]MDB5075153.1 hypothetical protein [Chloroflexota bacterium]
MQINVAQLLKWPVGTTRSYPIDTDEPLMLDDTTTFTLSGGRVRLDRIDSGILARGDVAGSVELECGRCLEMFQAPIQVHFEEEFAPLIEVNTGALLPPPEDELIFTIDPNHLLDLSEAIRQNTIASLPIQPICTPTCAGLCAICGGNRNLNPCTCADDEGENRPFAALRSLLH